MTTSYADTRVGVECLICDAGNTGDAAVCRECAAPLALTHDALAQEREPQIVTVLGESNVGKTVYLGFLLDMLSLRANEYEAIPKGPYSVDLQQSVISHLAWRMFPPKTPMESTEWHWAYYQVCKRDRANKCVDLLMPDMAGEALAAEIESPSTFRVIRSLLSKASGALVLVDAALAANGSARPDFFAVKLLSYLDSMSATKRDQRVGMPIAVVLCKADYCPVCFDDPGRFVEANLNRLWNLIESRFANVAFFASSVVGSLAYSSTPGSDVVTPVPLHVAPRGILEPFEWISGQI